MHPARGAPPGRSQGKDLGGEHPHARMLRWGVGRDGRTGAGLSATLSPCSWAMSRCRWQQTAASSKRPSTLSVLPRFPLALASPMRSPMVLEGEGGRLGKWGGEGLHHSGWLFRWAGLGRPLHRLQLPGSGRTRMEAEVGDLGVRINGAGQGQEAGPMPMGGGGGSRATEEGLLRPEEGQEPGREGGPGLGGRRKQRQGGGPLHTARRPAPTHACAQARDSGPTISHPDTETRSHVSQRTHGLLGALPGSWPRPGSRGPRELGPPPHIDSQAPRAGCADPAGAPVPTPQAHTPGPTPQGSPLPCTHIPATLCLHPKVHRSPLPTPLSPTPVP